MRPAWRPAGPAGNASSAAAAADAAWLPPPPGRRRMIDVAEDTPTGDRDAGLGTGSGPARGGGADRDAELRGRLVGGRAGAVLVGDRRGRPPWCRGLCRGRGRRGPVPVAPRATLGARPADPAHPARAACPGWCWRRSPPCGSPRAILEAPRRDPHPTLSSLANAALDSHAARAARVPRLARRRRGAGAPVSRFVTLAGYVALVLDGRRPRGQRPPPGGAATFGDAPAAPWPPARGRCGSSSSPGGSGWAGTCSCGSTGE